MLFFVNANYYEDGHLDIPTKFIDKSNGRDPADAVQIEFKPPPVKVYKAHETIWDNFTTDFTKWEGFAHRKESQSWFDDDAKVDAFSKFERLLFLSTVKGGIGRLYDTFVIHSEGSCVAAGCKAIFHEGSDSHALPMTDAVALAGSNVVAHAGSKVKAYRGSKVRSLYGSFVKAMDGSVIKKHDGSTVITYDNCKVTEVSESDYGKSYHVKWRKRK